MWWRLLSSCILSCAFGVIVDYFWRLNCPQVNTPVLSFIRTFKCQENWLAICLGYYELCMLLVLFFQFLRGTSKKHFCCRNWFGLKNAFVFFQMFCIQYFIWDSKLFVFHAEKKTKRSPVAPLGKFTRAGLTFRKLLQTANNSLPKVNMIFNSCSIGNVSNMLSLTAILSKAMILCEIKLM